MPNIKPVSSLRNYGEVLKEVEEGEPVFLTKNGTGKYVLLEIKDYDRILASLRLSGELSKGEASAREKGWIGMEEIRNLLDQ